MVNYQKILELISNKDSKGLDELYKSYGRKFYGYAVQKWRLSEDDAWNVVYKTLETLVLKLPNYTFESEAHFRNFLFKVFVNFLRQNFRSQRANQKDIVFVDFNEDPSENGDDPSSTSIISAIDKQVFNQYYQEESIQDPRISQLNLALDELPSDERDLLQLRAQGFSYDEIAAFLKVENNQLKVKHLRIKNKLIKILSEKIINDKNEQSK